MYQVFNFKTYENKCDVYKISMLIYWYDLEITTSIQSVNQVSAWMWDSLISFDIVK